MFKTKFKIIIHWIFFFTLYLDLPIVNMIPTMFPPFLCIHFFSFVKPFEMLYFTLILQNAFKNMDIHPT